MRNFVLRLIINAAALTGAAALLPGIHIRDDAIGTLIIVALVFGLVNAILKPFLIIMSCPLVILTLGLFTIVINGVLLLITDALAGDRFTVDTLGWAILGGLIVGFVSGILENALGMHDEEYREQANV